MTMTNHQEFLRRFESAEMPGAELTHTAHVRMAWLYLRAHPLPEALARIRDGIRHFAEVHGVGALYHETITIAYALLIASRLEDGADDWDEFARANPELFEPKLGVLRRYYDEQTLQSPRAKQHFVWPDKLGE
jgi:hypothetical protein